MQITVLPRTNQTKGAKKRRLSQGFVPASIYGRDVEPTMVEVSAKEIVNVLLADSGMNTILDVKIAGSKASRRVLIDNLERDPITRNFQSVGFHEIKTGDKVHVQIPIQVVGTPRDVEINGALLEQTLDTIDVTAKAADLPPHLEVDVSKLKIGDVLRVADLNHGNKITITTPGDVPIVSVHVSTTAQQVEESAATAPVSEGMPTGRDAVTEMRADSDPATDSVTGTEVS